MCGIVGLHIRDESLYPQLGALMTDMLGQMVDRGPDSAGVAVYGDRIWAPEGQATVTVLIDNDDIESLRHRVSEAFGAPIESQLAGGTVILNAVGDADHLVSAVREGAPEAVIVGLGHDVTVLKGVGLPNVLAEEFGLSRAGGWQGLGHTRMATESAVTTAGSHPFSVGPDQCMVHNGSFSNYMTIRHELERQGVGFDTWNDTEVAARFLAKQIADGADTEQALTELAARFDGFYTLLVSTSDSFAVVRDPIACKPAVIAEHDGYIAMASEYRALAGLPGIDEATLFEPEPDRIYVWQR